MKKKGFTLIELLAVIIILAVIALIATPVVLDVIENSRRSAFESSANGYYNAARYVYDEMVLKNDTQDILFAFQDEEQISSNSNYKLQVKGEKPKGGMVYLSSDGQIMVSIHNGKYCATTDESGKVSLSEDINNCVQGVTTIPEQCYSIKNEPISSDTYSEEDWAKANYNMLYYQGGEGCPTDADLLIIPSEVNGEKVEGIGTSAFSNMNSIKSLILPSGIKVTDEDSFYDKGITSVVLPESIIHLGYESFGTNNLTHITIPSNIIAIASYTFYNNKLTNIEIPSNVKIIDYNAFQHNQLTNITIPESVTMIGNNAFSNNQLTSVEISSSVTSIDFAAFNNNQLPDDQAFIYARNSDGTEDKTTIVSYGGAKRDNVEIPNSVINIGDNAFSNNQLTSINIPSSVINIGEWAFSSNQLMNVVIPNSVKTIGWYAFYDIQLTTVTIGTSVTSIGGWAFSKNQLTSVTIPNSVITIEGQAFSDNQLTNLELSNGITSINSYAFQNNQLTNIIIPSSVTTIGYNVFSGNNFSNANAITVEGDNPNRFDSEWTSIGFPAK